MKRDYKKLEKEVYGKRDVKKENIYKIVFFGIIGIMAILLCIIISQQI